MNQGQDKKFIFSLNAHSIIEFLDLVGVEIRSHGYQIKYIPQNGKIADTAEKILQDEDIHSDYLYHEPLTKFESLCEKYGIDSPRELVFPQMVYDRSYDSPSYRRYRLSGVDSLDYGKYLKLLHRTIDYLDVLYENGDGGIPLQFQGAEVLRRVLQRVADYHGYQSVRTSFSPVPRKLLFRSKEAMSLPSLEEAAYEEMTAQERETAMGFREEVISNNKHLIGSSPETGAPRESIQRKTQRIREYKQDIFPVAMDWIRRRIAKRALGYITKRMYLNEIQSRRYMESNQYVFYPIQYFRESRVTMRAPEFYNQLWLIEYLSRSLPSGHELVIKDHPQQLGALPLSHVRAMNRYATAISPSIPAREVVTHADAVVTLNNTVGYEAVMYGKPVVTLGDAFYSDAGYTQDNTDLGLLTADLTEAVNSAGLGDTEVLEFVHGILKSSYDGTWGDTTQENVEKFAESILNFLSE